MLLWRRINDYLLLLLLLLYSFLTLKLFREKGRLQLYCVGAGVWATCFPKFGSGSSQKGLAPAICTTLISKRAHSIQIILHHVPRFLNKNFGQQVPVVLKQSRAHAANRLSSYRFQDPAHRLYSTIKNINKSIFGTIHIPSSPQFPWQLGGKLVFCSSCVTNQTSKENLLIIKNITLVLIV